MSISRGVQRFLVLAAASFGVCAPVVLSGCGDRSTRPEPAGRASEPILQFAAVADPDETAGVTEFKAEGQTIRLRKPRTFEIQKAQPSVDALGYPAIEFEIADVQKDEFHDWTESLVHRRVAILVDGVVVTAPMVGSPLPGRGMISPGATHWSEQQARELADRIRGRGAAASK